MNYDNEEPFQNRSVPFSNNNAKHLADTPGFGCKTMASYTEFVATILPFNSSRIQTKIILDN